MLQRLVLSSFDGGGNEDEGDTVTMVKKALSSSTSIDD